MNVPAVKCSVCGGPVDAAPVYASTGEVVCVGCEGTAKNQQIRARTARDDRSKRFILGAALGAFVLLVVVAGLIWLKGCVATSGPL